MKVISRSEDRMSYVAEVRCPGCEHRGITRGSAAITVKILVHDGVSNPISCEYLTGNRKDMCKKFSINPNEWGYCRYVKMR